MSKRGLIDRLIRVLQVGLDYPTRQALEGRTRKMLSDVDFLVQRKDRKTLIVIREGWTPDAIKAVCVLSVFYQVVLGPIASSARSDTECGVGGAIPIRYGGLELFDSERAARVNEMHSTFMRMIGKLNIGRFWLEKSSADDLIFQMARDLGSSPKCAVKSILVERVDAQVTREDRVWARPCCSIFLALVRLAAVGHSTQAG